MHRRGNGRREWEERKFAQAACPKGPIRIGYFQNDRFDRIRDIQDGRNEIRAELVGQDVTIPGDEIFRQGIALGLHHRALDLSLHQPRVDGLADIIGGDHPQEL